MLIASVNIGLKRPLSPRSGFPAASVFPSQLPPSWRLSPVSARRALTMADFDREGAMPAVADTGAKTGLDAAFVRQIISTAVPDIALAEQLVVAIFQPIARRQMEQIREVVTAYGGSEQDIQALIEGYGRGVVLGSHEGRPS
jgi:hypothetical protein